MAIKHLMQKTESDGAYNLFSKNYEVLICFF